LTLTLTFVFYLAIYRFTSRQAFRNLLKEVGDLAGQREVVSETLQLQIIQGVTLLSKTLREERKVRECGFKLLINQLNKDF